MVIKQRRDHFFCRGIMDSVFFQILFFSLSNSSLPLGLQPPQCPSAVLQGGRMFGPMGCKGFVSAWREDSGDGDEEQHAFLQTMRHSALLLP